MFETIYKDIAILLAGVIIGAMKSFFDHRKLVTKDEIYDLVDKEILLKTIKIETEQKFQNEKLALLFKQQEKIFNIVSKKV